MAKHRKEELSESEQSDTNSSSSASTTNDSESTDDDSERSHSPKPEPQHEDEALSKFRSEFNKLSPLEKFLALNNNLTEVKCGFKLSKKDDVAFLQIPRSINPEELLEKTINFNKKTKIKLNGVKYVIRPMPVEPGPLLVLGKKLQSVKPVSCLQVVKHIKNKEIGDLQALEESKIPLPDNLKVRHPLFGADYRNKIVLDPAIEKKLNETIEESFKKPKKAKKKKVHEATTDETVHSFFNDEPKKKAKKIKKLANSTLHPDTELPDFDLDFSRIGNSLKWETLRSEYETEDENTKKKKKKKKRSSSDLDVSVDQINGDIASIFQQSQSEGSGEEQPRKKKKKRRSSEYVEELEETVKFLNGDSTPKKVKKIKTELSTSLPEMPKKKKIKAETSSLVDLSIVKKEKGSESSKKKKKFQEAESFAQESIASPAIVKKKKIKMEPSEDTAKKDHVTPKKKKIKQEKQDGDRLIKDILNSVKIQLDGSTHKKKKHH